MTAMTLRFPEDVYESLRQEAFDRRVSMASIVLDAVSARGSVRGRTEAERNLPEIPDGSSAVRERTEAEDPWTAWDGIWRTIPQDRVEQTRVLMTWRKRELVEALIAERQADLQRSHFGISFLTAKVASLEAALAAADRVASEGSAE